MAKSSTPEPTNSAESSESFESILSQFEKTHSHKAADAKQQLEGTVVSMNDESVFLDIGYKTEGVLPRSIFEGAGQPVKAGDKLLVSVKGRNEEGYYELSRTRVQRPTDWSALEQAFAEKATILGTVTGVIKGGLTVDVGVRAFLPASRSGTRDAAELEKLVGQEIRCKITKLDVADEDVVVDRRAIVEEEDRAAKGQRYQQVREGDSVHGTVRSLTDYGAFVDIGGVDALLHIGDIAWSRVNKPGDVLTVGQEIDAKVLKVDPEKQRISIGLKQAQGDPWLSVANKYNVGERISGVVSRVMDFGAFTELEPGVEGLIHISEMSWGKKVKKVTDVVKPGDRVEAVILNVNAAERRISLGLKQALGDPWVEAAQKLIPGSVVEGPITSMTNFGAFMQVGEGIEGMIHISEITAERRLNHPREILRLGEQVKAQVLAVDREKRQLKLSMKQLVPTGIDEYLEEHKAGDSVTGRIIEISGDRAQVELGEGIVATARITEQKKQSQEPAGSKKADLSSLGSMLQARWKSGTPASEEKPSALAAGQIRSFKITKLDAATKTIEVEIA